VPAKFYKRESSIRGKVNKNTSPPAGFLLTSSPLVIKQDFVLAFRSKFSGRYDNRVAFVDRGSGLSNLEGRQALDLAIATGRGGVFLSLTTDQYSQLQMHCRPTSAGSNAG
jgi:hypothetical protein